MQIIRKVTIPAAAESMFRALSLTADGSIIFEHKDGFVSAPEPVNPYMDPADAFDDIVREELGAPAGMSRDLSLDIPSF